MNQLQDEVGGEVADTFARFDDDHPWRIVLVDDQSFDRAEAKAALLRGSTRRYTFVECETASEALAVVEEAHVGSPSDETRVDCLVLDYRLPDADAPEFLDRLPRAEEAPNMPSIPVVVITGADMGESGAVLNRAALRAGAQNFVGKDWLTPASITRAVEGATERHAMAREIAQRGHALRASEEGQRLALDAADLGAWSLNPDTDHAVWDAKTRELFGASDGDTASGTLLGRVHPNDRQAVEKALEAALETNGGYDSEYRVQRPDGVIRWIHARGQVLTGLSDGGRRLIGIVQDTTERREAEEALASLNEELEHRVAKRTAELERANEGLEERNQELQQFAYIASHDLQEPLRMVTSFLQLLQRRYASGLDETANEYIEYAVDGASRMKVLIRDLLAFSRVGTRGQPLKRVNLKRVVETVVHDLGTQIEETGAEVEVESLPTVEADPSQIGQVFQNLISNALKFRREGETPRVHIGAKRSEGTWVIHVQDNGIGLEEKYEDRVFQIFQRLHSREEYDGTGIGLAIVKRIVERHGGRVWYESEVGKGTTFFLALPETQPKPAREKANENASRA